MGVLWHQGCLHAMGASKHMEDVKMPQIYGGVNSMPPSVELTCHQRKLGVFEHMGVLGASG